MATWSGLALMVALALGDPPREATEARPSPSSVDAAKVDDWGADASVHTTAEDVLDALQKLRPRNEPIAPAGRKPRGMIEAGAKLWPEGARLIGRTGRLVLDDAWWTFAMEPEGGAAPLRLLPNATLEAMVRSDAPGGARRYVISGEMTVFEGENYLLPRYATGAMGGGPGPAAVSPSTAKSKKETVAGADSAARGDVRTKGPVASDASAEDVLALLAAQQPGQSLIATTQEPVGEDVRTLAAGQAVLMDGTPLVKRPGRIVRDGRWWTFVLESEHSEYPEPPLRLLPNQNMELMVHAVQRNKNGVVFIVSGEVSAYGGENYLLARAVLQRSDLGNLRK